MLSDTEPIARRNAAAALGIIGDRRAIEPLKRMAEEDSDERNREVARDTLANMPNVS